MNEELHDVEVELKGWGVGGKGEGAKLTLTFAFDVALGDSRPVARMLAEAFPDLADAMQRGADEADREVELTWPARYLGGRRFTGAFFGAPAAKRMGGATNLPALRFVDCVLSGKVIAKVKGDAAGIIIKVSTPTETCADGDGEELGVRTLARLNHTNLFMDVVPQEADATDAENRDEAPKRRQLSFADAVDEVVDASEKMGGATAYVRGGFHADPRSDEVAVVLQRGEIFDGDTRGLDEDGDDNDFDEAEDDAESSEDGAVRDVDDDRSNVAEIEPDTAGYDAQIIEDADPAGPYEVRLISAAPRADIMTTVIALKRMFGLDNNLAKMALQRAINGAGITIVGRGLSERAAQAYVVDLAKHQITAEAAVPGALDRDPDYTPPTEKAVRAMYNDGTLDTYLAALSDAEARALHLSLTQNATRASAAEIADKVRAWLRKPKAVGA